MDKAEAQSLIEKELARDQNSHQPIDVVVLEKETIERDWGWVFFYQSKKYMETGKFRDGLAGNAPYIVNRKSGQITLTGTAHPIEHYIHEYEQSL